MASAGGSGSGAALSDPALPSLPREVLQRTASYLSPGDALRWSRASKSVRSFFPKAVFKAGFELLV
jgi:hypothetical protein